MDKKRSIQDFKEELSKLRSVTSWKDVEDDTIYHIPPIISLDRRDVRVIKKDGAKATYYRIGDSTKEERTMFETSVFAKFIVKRRKF